MRTEKLEVFILELVEGELAYIGDEWHVELPLTDGEEEHAKLVVYLAGNESKVDIDLFCSAARLACLFYRAHINAAFDSLTHIVMLDELCLHHLKTSH